MRNTAKASLLTVLFLLSLASCKTKESSSPEPEPSSSADPLPSVEPIADYDVVGQTKIHLSDEVFAKVMQKKTDSTYDPSYQDFNRDGVERMGTNDDKALGADSKGKDILPFTNYVDGDTTQFSSYNGNYTVKVRYLAIDTPESTSEVEEWGKAASNFNKSVLKKAKHVIVQSATSARTGENGAADLDVYQRSLAYVWYSDAENPTKDDFRNLNLELVYNGLALFNGKESDMEPSFYKAFFDADTLARQKKVHLYSGKKDPDYYYGAPKALGLDEIYDTSRFTQQDENGIPYSVYCDDYTRWTFEGVVTRTVGTSFYLQDTIDGKTYGLYVFTLRSYAIVAPGARIKVTGILDFYGGAYELKGVHWNFFNHAQGDMEEVLDKDGKPVTEEVKPIEATPSEIASGKYPGVLVKVVPEKGKSDSNLYFNTTFGSHGTSYAYGGTEEINSYNEAYPFYNTDGSMVLFGRYGSDMENVSSFSTLTKTSDYLRIKIPSDLRLSDTVKDSPTYGQTITSYTYFTGTKDADGKESYHYYVAQDAPLCKKIQAAQSKVNDGSASALTFDKEKKGAPDATDHQEGDLYVDGGFNATGADVYEATKESGALTFEKIRTNVRIARTSFVRKKANVVVGIAINYVSTSGNQKYSLNVCNGEDLSGFAALE